MTEYNEMTDRTPIRRMNTYKEEDEFKEEEYEEEKFEGQSTGFSSQEKTFNDFYFDMVHSLAKTSTQCIQKEQFENSLANGL